MASNAVAACAACACSGIRPGAEQRHSPFICRVTSVESAARATRALTSAAGAHALVTATAGQRTPLHAQALHTAARREAQARDEAGVFRLVAGGVRAEPHASLRHRRTPCVAQHRASARRPRVAAGKQG